MLCPTSATRLDHLEEEGGAVRAEEEEEAEGGVGLGRRKSSFECFYRVGE